MNTRDTRVNVETQYGKNHQCNYLLFSTLLKWALLGANPVKGYKNTLLGVTLLEDLNTLLGVALLEVFRTIQLNCHLVRGFKEWLLNQLY